MPGDRWHRSPETCLTRSKRQWPLQGGERSWYVPTFRSQGPSLGLECQTQLPCYISNMSRHSYQVNNTCTLTSFQKASDPQEHKAGPILDSTGDRIILMPYHVWTYLNYEHTHLATKDDNSSKTARAGTTVDIFSETTIHSDHRLALQSMIHSPVSVGGETMRTMGRALNKTRSPKFQVCHWLAVRLWRSWSLRVSTFSYQTSQRLSTEDILKCSIHVNSSCQKCY